MKSIIKKLIPRKIKQKLRNEFAPKSTLYELHVSDKGKLDGKTAIVTGGSGAIGSAICFRLAMEGAIVGVCGRDMGRIQKVINNIETNGGRAVALILDVNNTESIKTSLEKFCEQYGRLDIWVNNAGGSARGNAKEFAEQSFDIIDDVITTNLRGTMLCTRMALNYLNDGGRILSTSSVVGMQGKSGMTDYAAAKAGIIGFTRSLALELGKRNITVNCISPGWVSQTVFDRGRPVAQANVNAMGRCGRTDEVADAVAFLVSDEAKYITGQNIVIDGGRSLGLWGDN